MQSPNNMKPAPQDAPYNNNQSQTQTSQIESLEQALRIQITKRIETETLFKSHKTVTVTVTPTKEIQTNLEDLQELMQGFILDVDGLDGDAAEKLMERRDVLWMLNELNLRVKDFVGKYNAANAANASNGNDRMQEDIIQEEMNVAVLQGQIAQLQETNQRLITSQNNNSNNPSSPNRRNTSSSTPTKMTEQHRILLEKHHHLEQRHGNITREMQESISLKNQEIQELKHALQSSFAPPLAPESNSLPGPVQLPVVSPMSPPNASHFLTHAPHKDIQIASLMEEIEDRNAVIEELREELDSYIMVDTQVQTMELDKIKLKYLENIIHELEGKIKEMNNGNGYGNGNGTKNENKSHGSSPTGKYGSMAWGWSGSCSSLVDENLACAFPGAVSSSIMEDMELRIVELTERWQDSEEERLMLKGLLDRLQSTSSSSS